MYCMLGLLSLWLIPVLLKKEYQCSRIACFIMALQPLGLEEMTLSPLLVSYMWFCKKKKQSFNCKSRREQKEPKFGELAKAPCDARSFPLRIWWGANLLQHLYPPYLFATKCTIRLSYSCLAKESAQEVLSPKTSHHLENNNTWLQ